MVIVIEARKLAEEQLAESEPRRWSHVQAVASKAATMAQVLHEGDREVLVCAAWLHDVGYAPSVVDTGFHPLDGARWLRRVEFDSRVTALVAHHTLAVIEADERGLREALVTEFPREESMAADALLFCDITTGPDGEDLAATERLDEIRGRYGPDHVVTRFVDRAQPDILAAVDRVAEQLRRTDQPR